jgi:serine/threonine protein kinase
VYISTDGQFEGQFAVKHIDKTTLASPNYFAEAKAMFAASHEHVVPVQYACQTADDTCLAMPYYQRGSLTDRITLGPIRLSEVIRVGQGVLSGLGRIHASGHLHLDVKPSNVLFDDKDTPMVADFGQAQRLDATGASPAPATMYGPGIPPEMVLKNDPRIQADVYQAGLTLYRAVNGEPLFDEQVVAVFGTRDESHIKNAIVRSKFPDRSRFLPHVPKSMRSAIRKALNVDVTKRYASAAEFAKALARLTFKNDWSATPMPNDEVEWRAIRRGQPDLIVSLKRAKSEWCVQIHSQRPGVSVRRYATGSWIPTAKREECLTRLTQIFESLERG